MLLVRSDYPNLRSKFERLLKGDFNKIQSRCHKCVKTSYLHERKGNTVNQLDRNLLTASHLQDELIPLGSEHGLRDAVRSSQRTVALPNA